MSPDVMNPDEIQIRGQLDRWFAGWSPGATPFDPTVLRPLFAEGQIHVVDDFGDKVVTIDSFDGYAATWAPVMAGFSDWAIRPAYPPRVDVATDMAAVTFAFIGQGLTKDGRAVEAAQHATQIWRKRGERWVIVHEHLTSDNPKNLEG